MKLDFATFCNVANLITLSLATMGIVNTECVPRQGHCVPKHRTDRHVVGTAKETVVQVGSGFGGCLPRAIITSKGVCEALAMLSILDKLLSGNWACCQ